MIFKSFTYYFAPLSINLRIDIGLLWYLTYFFIGLGMVYFVVIFYLKNSTLKRSRKVIDKRSELAPIISNFLFHAPDDPVDEQKEYINLKIEIRDYLRNKNFRNLLSEILFDLQKDVSGTTEERLYNLYRELGLHHDAYEKVKSLRWHIVSKGILELTDMKVTESYHIISKFINHKRGAIRKQAEIATVKMRHEGINYILDYTRYSISEWQQIKLIEALTTLKDYQPPKFKAWLISNNKDVVLFALRLIQHYNQNEAEAAIIELLKHKNQQIRLEAVNCIKDFNFTSAKPTLKAIFTYCENELKIQILDVFCEIGDTKDLDFLNKVISQNKSFLVTSKAGSAVNSIVPESILPTIDIDDELVAESDEKEVIKEVTTAAQTEEKSIEITKIQDAELIALDNVVPNDEKKDLEISLELEENLLETISTSNLDETIIEPIDFIYNIPKGNTTIEEYLLLDTLERRHFIDSIIVEEAAEKIDFLELILEKEVSNDLRFLVFKKLKSVKEEEKFQELIEQELKLVKAPNSEVILESIFNPLFKKASDEDSKLILIKQMISLGDKKELVFLRSLHETENGRIKKAISKAIAALEKNIESKLEIKVVEAIEEQDVLEGWNDDENNNQIKVNMKNPNDFNEKEIEVEVEDYRLPLEFCFLTNELDDDFETSEKDLVFDFELSEEFYN